MESCVSPILPPTPVEHFLWYIVKTTHLEHTDVPQSKQHRSTVIFMMLSRRLGHWEFRSWSCADQSGASREKSFGLGLQFRLFYFFKQHVATFATQLQRTRDILIHKCTLGDSLRSTGWDTILTRFSDNFRHFLLKYHISAMWTPQFSHGSSHYFKAAWWFL